MSSPPSSDAPDHAALETFVGRMLDACENGATDRMALRWEEFEDALVRQFEDEERVLLAPLLATRPREASVLLEEHRYLRRRVAQIGSQRGALKADTLGTFLDELRAHGRHEQRALHRRAPEGDRPGTLPEPT